METKKYSIEGPNGKRVTLIGPVGMELPSHKLSEYGGYCGAGKGLQEKLVPDTIYGLKVSPACFIHDTMWEFAEATWEAFHYSNSIFLRNTNALIIGFSKYKFVRSFRMYRSVTYFNAVDVVGPDNFWELKKRQGWICKK